MLTTISIRQEGACDSLPHYYVLGCFFIHSLICLFFSILYVKIGVVKMIYIIDSADTNEIKSALQSGIEGVTANASMYAKHHIPLHDFLNIYANTGLSFLSGEVMCDTYEEMLEEALHIHAIDNAIVIKINFSIEGLRLASELHKRGIKTAMTLLFTMSQCIAAINAHVDYLFFFIGRNEEHGTDGLKIIHSIQKLIIEKSLSAKVVAASIKNLYQLECLADMHIDYAAIPYVLYLKSLFHPLTEQGAITFKKDWEKISQ